MACKKTACVEALAAAAAATKAAEVMTLRVERLCAEKDAQIAQLLAEVAAHRARQIDAAIAAKEST